MIKIDSDTLIPIEQHFRVSAGPGAGKTYWLVQHIKNVLFNSKRLRTTRKVACITYTNIAVDTIKGRLGEGAEQVEVSTIHSFLYKHVVKPYASFLVEDFGLKVEKMDGHDDTILSNYSFLNEWKTRTNQHRITEPKVLVEAFKRIKWVFDDKDELLAVTDYPIKVNNYSIKKTSYIEYKRMSWERGVVHHDDVLFFSYQLLKKHPFILKVLQAKFPYFFIDEFQDTSPIQLRILEMISSKETVIGIIGDAAQTIYEFQGTDAKQFNAFALPEIEDYWISTNRRSTDSIINVLNYIRTDMIQDKYRGVKGDTPVLIIGNMDKALNEARERCNNYPVYSLTRYNITSNAIRKVVSGEIKDDKLLDELLFADKPTSGNKYRSKVVLASLRAVEYARENKYRDSIKELEKEFRRSTDNELSKKEALQCIIKLVNNYEVYKDGSMMDFFNFVKSEIKTDISNLAKGTAKTFYDTYTYKQLAMHVNIVDSMNTFKTIHKSKGDEFDNVVVILGNEEELDFLLKPNFMTNEEHRIRYVAVSRAKENLFINIPTLSKSSETELQELFEICRL